MMRPRLQDSVARCGWLLVIAATAFSCAPLRGPGLAPPENDVAVCTWMGCKRGALSFSIDDGATICREEMEAAGFRGTYYYNGSATLPWFFPYSAAGHEIGSHLTDHVQNCTARPIVASDLTPEALRQVPFTPEQVTAFQQKQIEPNIAAIEAGTGSPVVSMAWPCGCTDAGRIAAAAAYVVGARGYYDPWECPMPWVRGLNDPTPLEFQNLNAADHFDQTFVERAVDERRWAILTTHDICTGIDFIGAHRDALWVAPVGDVLNYIRVRNAARFTNYVRTEHSASFDVKHSLKGFQRRRVDGSQLLPILFENPVTLRLRLFEKETVTSVDINRRPVDFAVVTEEGVRYVMFDTPLHNRQHVAIRLSVDETPRSGRGDQVESGATPPSRRLDPVLSPLAQGLGVK